MFVDLLILLGVAIAVGIPLWAIIDAARRPASSFQQIGSDKTRWIVMISVVLSRVLQSWRRRGEHRVSSVCEAPTAEGKLHTARRRRWPARSWARAKARRCSLPMKIENGLRRIAPSL